MKKLVAIVFMLMIVAIVLIALAFYYVDLSGHKGFRYDLFVDGRGYGEVRVDRYVTEDKLIYKSSASYPYTSGYPNVNEKLFLKKRTVVPLKYVEEAGGSNGEGRLILLVQNDEKTDYLFLRQPRFFSMKGFETGEKTMVFSPYSIMLYMPIMEKYNFWKKGAQFFEVMMPLNEPVPPMRDKLEVRYLNDEYVPVMGRKVEAEVFTINSRGLPEVRAHLAKYTHRILSLEIRKTNMRFVLTGFSESPGKRFRSLLDTVIRFVRGKGAVTGETGQTIKPAFSEKAGAYERTVQGAGKMEYGTRSREIFFESDNLILSGKIWIPAGEGRFPAVLIIPGDGSMTNGERWLIDSCGEFLSSSGFIAFSFDGPGRGKSQGSVWDQDDGKRISNIRAAVSYLQSRPDVRGDSISLLGHKGGGYLALKAAGDLPNVRCGVVLGMPPGPGIDGNFHRPEIERIQAMLKTQGLGPFDEGYMNTIAGEVEKHIKETARSAGDFSYFLGVKIPVKNYRGIIARRPYDVMMSFDRPLLLVCGRNDADFSQSIMDEFRRALKGGDDRVKVAVFRNLPPYLGEMVEEGKAWRFKANKDVLELVGNWLRDNGVSRVELMVTTADKTAI